MADKGANPQQVISEMSGEKLLELALMLGVIDLAEIEEEVRNFPDVSLTKALNDMVHAFEEKMGLT